MKDETKHNLIASIFGGCILSGFIVGIYSFSSIAIVQSFSMGFLVVFASLTLSKKYSILIGSSILMVYNTYVVLSSEISIISLSYVAIMLSSVVTSIFIFLCAEILTRIIFRMETWFE